MRTDTLSIKPVALLVVEASPACMYVVVVVAIKVRECFPADVPKFATYSGGRKVVQTCRDTGARQG